MSTPSKRLAFKTRKAPLVQAGEWVVESTRFLFASLVLVYILALVSFQEVTTAKEAWEKTFQSTEWTQALLLELNPVLSISERTQIQQVDVMPAQVTTFSGKASEQA
jgi:hypothetical protein